MLDSSGPRLIAIVLRSSETRATCCHTKAVNRTPPGPQDEVNGGSARNLGSRAARASLRASLALSLRASLRGPFAPLHVTCVWNSLVTTNRRSCDKKFVPFAFVFRPSFKKKALRMARQWIPKWKIIHFAQFAADARPRLEKLVA